VAHPLWLYRTLIGNPVYGRVKELRGDQQQESEPSPADEIDLARTTSDVETHASLIAREEEKLRFVDEALARLETGIYGKCLECRMAIPIERLNVLPFAAYCVECQEKRNRSRRGWGEGTTLAPYDQQWTVPEEMEEPAEREYTSTGPEEEVAIHYERPFGPEQPVQPAPARKRHKTLQKS
jgi:RNA polymerase-binding transcription factor DksA